MRSSFRSAVTVAAVVSCIAVPAAAAPSQAPSAASALRWRSIGPFIGGRVVAVAGVASDPPVLYMGAVDGGLWESTDDGTSWRNITDGKLPGWSDAIGALAIAPSNPKIIYVGTGESDIRTDFVTGDGIYVSRNGGKTWSYAGLRQTHTTAAIAVSPRDPNVVYVASMGHVFVPDPDRGLFKTTDGGKTWTKVLFVNDRTGAISLAMDPTDPDVLYAAMWEARRTPWSLSSGGPGSGLYKTTDGGLHWAKISSNPGFPGGVLGRMGVAVAASDPKVVYAIVQAKHGGLFRSNDGGATWTRVNGEWKLRQRAFYYMTVAVDPRDPNTVYVPEVDALFVSHDGGKTFAPLHTPHGDNHAVWIDPRDPRILLEGNDGGATVSIDGGKTWTTEWNQPTGEFYHIAIDDRFPFHVYGAQQDEGSFEGPSASPEGAIGLGDWRRVAYGESTFVAPDPRNLDVTYGSGYYSIFMRYDATIGEFRDVSPWPYYQEGASSGELRYRFGWTHPILFSPADRRRLFIVSQYVFRSDDGGVTWRRISPDLTRNDRTTERPSGGPIDLDQSGAEIYPDISALGVSPRDGRVIWAGSSDGLVHVTRDGGAHWRLVTPSALPQWCEITSIEPSHDDPATAYLSASRYMWDDFHPYIYATHDYGAHWSLSTSGVPQDQYVFVVRQDPSDPHLLFAGTRSTVFVSFDGGARWQSLALNLPHVQVRDIAIDTREGEVAVATHGRAFWILDDLSLLEQIAARSSRDSSGLRLFAPQTAWLTHAYGSSPYPRPDTGQNPPFGATVFFELPASYDGKIPLSLRFEDSSGHVIRSFALHPAPAYPATSPSPLPDNPVLRRAIMLQRATAVRPGMNRFLWDLRYPDATEVRGFYEPAAAGGLPDSVEGPVVTPGRYVAVLQYGDRTLQRPFTVALDPRIHVSAAALRARLELGLRIHEDLDRLDRALNAAIAAREALVSSPARHGAPAAAASLLARLDRDIGDLVQLDIHASEGDLAHETKLRSHLAYLAADIDLSYTRPTPAQYGVYALLHREVVTGVRRLEDDLALVRRSR